MNVVDSLWRLGHFRQELADALPYTNEELDEMWRKEWKGYER